MTPGARCSLLEVCFLLKLREGSDPNDIVDLPKIHQAAYDKAIEISE